MDSLHEAHLERILGNRRRRGVLANHTSRHQAASMCTQTQGLGTSGTTEAPLLKKANLSFGSHSESDHVLDEETAPRENCLQTIHTVADSERSSVLGNGVNGHSWGDEPTVGGKAVAYGVNSNNCRSTLRFDDCSIGNVGRGPFSAVQDSRFGRRLSKNSYTFVDRSSYSSRIGRGFLTNKSPRGTVPLLTYGPLNVSFSSRWGKSESQRGRTLSPRVFRSLNGGKRSFSCDPDFLRARSGDNQFFLSRSGPLENRVDSSRVWRSSSTRRHWSTAADKFASESLDKRKTPATASVIYAGGDNGNAKDSFVFPRRHRPRVLLFPEEFPRSVEQCTSPTVQNNGIHGLSSSPTALDIHASVSILAAGDWFYKWNRKGTSVSPRWVWLDAQSHLLLWAHRETHDAAFAGVIKLEKIHHVEFRELQQPDINGALKTYHVLLVQTTKRLLQLATERRRKADVWYEALNNVMSYLKLQGFSALFVYPAT